MRDIREAAIAELNEIGGTRMPFGRYAGRMIYELPAEYLQYFAARGWPKSRLGELMRIVYQMKADGGDAIFAELRKRRATGPSSRQNGPDS